MSGACVLVCARTGSSCRASGSRWPTESLLIDLVCALDIELCNRITSLHPAAFRTAP